MQKEEWPKSVLSSFFHSFIIPSLNKQKPDAAKPNVRIRVRGRIVQIERERPRIRIIVPITAAKRCTTCERVSDSIPLIVSMLYMIE